jgi:hypothetical protein
MSQNYTTPSGTDIAADVLKTVIPQALDAVRTLFSGATAPSSPVALQFWADTTSGLLKQRNAANDGWVAVAPLAAPWTRQTSLVAQLATGSSATFALHLPPPPRAAEVVKLIVVGDASTSSTSGNEWTFALQNQTQAEALFSGTVGTFTSLPGVGGGDLTGDSAYELTPDQNAVIAAGDVLELTVAKVGSASNLPRLAIFAVYDLAA